MSMSHTSRHQRSDPHVQLKCCLNAGHQEQSVSMSNDVASLAITGLNDVLIEELGSNMTIAVITVVKTF